MERSRSRSLSTPATVDEWITQRSWPNKAYTSNFTEQTWTSTTTEGVAASEICDDVVTADFRAISRQGGIVNNPYLNVKTREDAPGRIDVDWYGTYTTSTSAAHHIFGHYHPNMVPYQFWKSDAFDADCVALKQSVQNIAVTQAHANIDESSMLALATIAESGKTIDSVRDIMLRVYRILKSLRRFDVKALKKQISRRELLDRYMEARYAIRPLLYDVHGVIEGLRETRTYQRATYRGFHAERIETSETVVKFRTAAEIDNDVVITRSYDVSARAGVLCDVEFSKLTAWGLDKITESAWELIPFSFIVDWFCNVGDTLAAWTPNAGVKQRASWVKVTEKLRVHQNYTNARGGSTHPVQTVVGGNFERSWDQTVVQRVPDPQVSVFPEVKLRIDGYKLADLGIIMLNLFSRK